MKSDFLRAILKAKKDKEAVFLKFCLVDFNDLSGLGASQVSSPVCS